MLCWGKVKVSGIEKPGDFTSAIRFQLPAKPHTPKDNSRIQMQIQIRIVMLVEVDIAFSIKFNAHVARAVIAADVRFKYWRVFEDGNRSSVMSKTGAAVSRMSR